MPKIPRLQRQQTIPGSSTGVREDPAVATQLGRTISDLADTAGDVAVGIQRSRDKVAAEETQVRTAIGKLRVKHEEADRAHSAMRIGNQITEDAIVFDQRRQELKGTDAYHSMDAVDDWEVRARETYLDGLDDIELSRSVEAHLAAKALSLRSSLSRHEARERSAVAESTRIATLRTSLQAANQGFGSLEENLQEYSAAVANDPTLSDEEAENKIMAGQSAIAAARIEGIISRNPDAAIELMDSGLYDPYLDDKARAGFLKKARAAEETRKRDAKAEAAESRRKAKEELAMQQEAQNRDFGAMHSKGELTEEKIEKSILDSNDRQYWRGQIAARTKAMAEAEEDGAEDGFKTKGSVKSPLIAKINQDPLSITPREIREKVGHGLSGDDAETLIEKREKAILQPLKSTVAKNGQKLLDDLLEGGAFGKVKSPEQEAVARGVWTEKVEMFERYMVNNPDATAKEAREFIDLLVQPDVEANFFRRNEAEAKLENERRDVRIERLAGKTIQELLAGAGQDESGDYDEWRIEQDTETGEYFQVNPETGEEHPIKLDEEGKVTR